MTPKLFTRIDHPDPTWFVRSHQHEFYLPTEVVVSEPKIVTPRVGRYYEIDLYVRDEKDLPIARHAEGRKHFHSYRDYQCVDWDKQVKLIPYDELRQLGDFHGTGREIQVCLYEIWGEFGSDGHTRYELVCWMLHPGECTACKPHEMHNHFYDHFRSPQPPPDDHEQSQTTQQSPKPNRPSDGL